MIDISCIEKRSRINQENLSLCGKLEAIIGNYYLSYGYPESEVETLYYDETIDCLHEAVNTAEKNIVAYYVNDESISFVKSEMSEKLQKETEEYGVTYIKIDDFDEEILWVNPDNKLPEYLGKIIWIDDDFLSDESIPFDYSAFEIIDSNVNYLNPKHFSVKQLVSALMSEATLRKT